ncbi:MAG TPA: VOC family protein [Solirubrobacterales bacterium]|nr:VOC family protein [Solirubrobacterales bacterium]
MLHHVLLEVTDLALSGVFYDAVLKPIGWRRHEIGRDTLGWGMAKPVFLISDEHPPKPGFGVITFSAPGIAAVKAAWEAGLQSGGESVAEPGQTGTAASGSYSAYLRDPDGYGLEITVGNG